MFSARAFLLIAAILPALFPIHSYATETAYGTGFFVSKDGHILTNHHVIVDCRAITTTVNGARYEAKIIGTDALNDLAVLQIQMTPTTIAFFREGRSVQPGEDVMAIGFPLPGKLASEAKVTTGTVSALSGMHNNSTFMQISAPIQPGNSGGPAIDENGLVVGVVTSILNAVKMVGKDSVIPQNVNFAIHAGLAKTFLDAYAVPYEGLKAGQRKTRAEIALVARRYTVPLTCHDQPFAKSDDAEMEKLRRLLLDVMDRDSPDWRTIVNGEDFKEWLAAQPRNYQEVVAASWDPQVIKLALQSFKNAKNRPNDHGGSLPSLQVWLPIARADNPGVPDEELITYWRNKYGTRGAREKEPPKRMSLSEEFSSDLDRELQGLKTLKLPPPAPVSEDKEPVRNKRPMFREPVTTAP
ncbi:MAG: HtrA protease/chaperone protein [Nitrospira sp.]|jgi:hypothetical protein|nr:MAG: HtrA protease/chaperone protein [Nitrospira sp.]